MSEMLPIVVQHVGRAEFDEAALQLQPRLHTIVLSGLCISNGVQTSVKVKPQPKRKRARCKIKGFRIIIRPPETYFADKDDTVLTKISQKIASNVQLALSEIINQKIDCKIVLKHVDRTKAIGVV